MGVVSHTSENPGCLFHVLHDCLKSVFEKEAALCSFGVEKVSSIRKIALFTDNAFTLATSWRLFALIFPFFKMLILLRGVLS